MQQSKESRLSNRFDGDFAKLVKMLEIVVKFVKSSIPYLRKIEAVESSVSGIARDIEALKHLRKEVESLRISVEALAKQLSDLRSVLEELGSSECARSRPRSLEERCEEFVSRFLEANPSGMELLSVIAPKNPARFVEMARSCGLVVVEGDGDALIAVEDAWRRFLEELPTLPSNLEEVRDPVKRRVLEFLRKNALAYYDNVEKRWRYLGEAR